MTTASVRSTSQTTLHAAAKAQNRTGSLIETGALRALALAATGDEAGAVTTLTGTLLLARPQGHVRVFADEGPPMAVLLGRLIAAQRTGQAGAEVPGHVLDKLGATNRTQAVARARELNLIP
jgi:LuxR family transcriptional regulator, maltose regulon positive regulatory protein